MANFAKLKSRGRVSDRRGVTTKLSPYGKGLTKMRAPSTLTSAEDGAALNTSDLKDVLKTRNLRSKAPVKKVDPKFTKLKKKK